MNPKTLLEEYDILPRKSLGQNFLHDPNMLDKIVSIADLTKNDLVLEVGPGTGLLTERLAQASKEVTSIEVDERLQPVLAEIVANHPNLSIRYQDILTLDINKLYAGLAYIVVANLPYYITSAIIKHLLESDHPPTRLVLTMQMEVAERMIAKPDDMSILSVSVQFFGRPQIAARLKPSVFWPRPEVDSAVVRIDTYDKPQVDVPDTKTFFRVVRAGFGQKRKQLKNALSSGLALDADTANALFDAAKIDSRRRAETLSLEDWATLTRAYISIKP
ncbi:MAG: 16S rRNA (adenine(1518)-N(6)/adenine(1519)-N(6))-dimethyltransferase RsmA [Chloroflexi bacterium]|nr:16S rRNA (adenine(1518)-N(6)/adenine(1519)-N(6))-dimethyltransferase RsmA [Chloroflexota bacterium]MCC6895146.1 16S rRNA (adenine(1518)-N(6)/adenine(1519)-N(6))-dimethyltransferase RsmA [Anaerolineae bacterium]